MDRAISKCPLNAFIGPEANFFCELFLNFLLVIFSLLRHFYIPRRSNSAVYAMALCPYVCPSAASHGRTGRVCVQSPVIAPPMFHPFPPPTFLSFSP